MPQQKRSKDQLQQQQQKKRRQRRQTAPAKSNFNEMESSPMAPEAPMDAAVMSEVCVLCDTVRDMVTRNKIHPPSHQSNAP